MRASQADRTRIAERATAAGRTPTRNAGRVSTDLGARPSTVVPPRLGKVRKSRAKMTGAQRNSEGRRSEWSMSPYFFTDPKWSATVSK